MPAGKINPLARGYRTLIVAGSNLQSVTLLLFRLAWGWMLLEAGSGKLMHPEKVANFFSSLHIPMPLFSAYLCGGTECVGGALLLLGFGTRLIALPLIFNFLVAFITADRDDVIHLFTQKPDGLINFDAFPYLMMVILMLAFGPGKISIDHLLRKSVAKRHDPPREAI
jgi:putative oxidoreductase